MTALERTRRRKLVSHTILDPSSPRILSGGIVRNVWRFLALLIHCCNRCAQERCFAAFLLQPEVRSDGVWRIFEHFSQRISISLFV